MLEMLHLGGMTFLVQSNVIKALKLKLALCPAWSRTWVKLVVETEDLTDTYTSTADALKDIDTSGLTPDFDPSDFNAIANAANLCRIWQMPAQV